MQCSVTLSKHAQKELEKLPLHIAHKLEYWVNAVETYGITEVKKVPGYHDEPLRGDRKDQRSIRLNKAYRAIYEETDEDEIRLILILEISKHEY